MSRAPLIQLPPPGVEAKPLPGVRLWVNAMNGFVVAEVHYTADPARRGDWKLKAAPKYGGFASWRWRKEQEIDWDAKSGSLVFELWDKNKHVITPFTIPEHWPRWVLFDPGWRNQASIVWVAVDVDTKPDMFGNLPVHVYREFYQSNRAADTCARIAYEWSAPTRDEEGNPLLEWIEEIHVDPAAKQEHQGAASGDNVNDSADTVLQKFQRKIDELKWGVPVVTGNNDKSTAIEEMITRLGQFWLNAEGVPLYDEHDKFRDPTADEITSERAPQLVIPTLFFHACCIDGSREMAKYRWRDWASPDVAERHNAPEAPLDKDDHTITNLIRFMNLLRGLRARDDGPDLSEFESREKPKAWRSPDEILAQHHRTLAARHRKRARLNRRT